MPYLSPRQIQSAKVKSSRSLAKRSAYILLGLIVISVVGLLSWHEYTKHAIAVDRARFVQAEKDIDKLSAQIIASTGQPLKTVKSKTCSRPNLKFQTGPLSCDIDNYIFYPANNYLEANRIYNSTLKDRSLYHIKETLTPSNSLDGVLAFKEIPETYGETRPNFQRISGMFQSTMSCEILYTFYKSDQPPYIEYSQSAQSIFSLGIKLSCTDSAKSEYYPLR